MTTGQELIEHTRSYLLSSHRDQQNVLAANYTAGDTSLSFQFAINGMTEGAYLSIGIEVLQVFDVNVGSKTCTVRGAQRGSTAADHATDDLVVVNPEFSDFAIWREINNDLRALSAPGGLYAVGTVAVTYNAAHLGYDLNAPGLIDVLAVQAEQPDSEKLWPNLRSSQWRVKRNADTSEFASGTSIMFYDSIGQPGRQMRVTYAKEFSPLTTPTDDVATVTGLPDSAIDVPCLGAAARLVGLQESKRVLLGSQRDPRRAEEVPPGAITGASRLLATMRAQRVSEERARLLKRYPARTR